MRSIIDYIALILLVLPLFLFMILTIPIQLLGYIVKIDVYKD